MIIDGYNLIGVSHESLEKQRGMLIDSLIGYKRRKGHEITVVFDGWKTGEARESKIMTGGIRIIFSRVGEKADSVIKRIISSEKREWIVVTSDRDIAGHAWASGSVPVSSEDFLRLTRRDPVPFPDEEEDDLHEPRRKGNPRKPSRKEKALKRALHKL